MGCPAVFVIDNLKAGVTRPCRYEPDVNRTYEEMAEHYGAVVIPARIRRPKDKPKAEISVLVAERWILAVLRNRTFFALAELNAVIRQCVAVINDRPMQKFGVSRRQLFEDIDRPAKPARRRRAGASMRSLSTSTQREYLRREAKKWIRSSLLSR